MNAYAREFAKLAREEDTFRRLTEKDQFRKHHYGDPAKHVEFESELRRQAEAKAKKLKRKKGKR